MSHFAFDIAIIGGGCIGTSILHELTHRGFNNVVLIDQGRNTVSATAQSGGMLRVFHESMEHVNLALANFSRLDTYRQLGVLTEKTTANGHLYFFHKDRYRHYQTNLLSMKEAGYPFEVLTSISGLQRFPDYHWHKNEWAIYEPLGCQLSPQKFTNDLCTASMQNGALLLDNVEVQRICPDRDRFRIFAQQLLITTKTLILAGGARLLPRFQDLGLCLPLETRLLTTYLSPKTETNWQLPNYFDRETLNFGGLGPGRHVLLSHPDSNRVTQKKWEASITQRSGQDCYAPNRQGFLGYVPGHPGLMLATGWGGTAFKFALEIAHRMVDVIEHGRVKRTAYA